MPCEACNTQFTVFKRKKSCSECRRLYCSNCLTKNKERILCKRCVIFTTRPLSKIELLKLKAKDLIFYLQSKHISTTGCVEKEELVNLVLTHVDNSNNFTPDSQQSQTSFSMGTNQGTNHSDDARSNPFDQIRNTCQNLFSTFTEKISADFNFDFKQNQSDRSNVCEDQPRYSNSFRNVNSFNSNSCMSNNSTTSNNGNLKPQRPTTMQTSSVNQSSRCQSANNFSNSNNNSTVIGGQQCHTSNSQSSPTITGNSSSASSPPSMLKSMSSYHALPRIGTTATTTATTAVNGSKSPQTLLSSASKSTKNKPAYVKIAKLSRVECCNDAGSGCECSDDELITKFRQSYADSLSPTALTVTDKESQVTDNNKSDHLTTASSSSSSSSSSAKPTEHASDAALKEEASALESSDISSFEDLGAVAQTNVNAFCAPNDTDKWQIVNPTWNIDDTASTSSIITDYNNEIANNSSNSGGIGTSHTTNLPNSITELPQAKTNESENQRQTPYDEMTDITFPQQQHQHSATSTQQRPTTDLRKKLEKTLKSRQTHRKITRRQSDGIVYTASTSNSNNRTGRFLDDVDDDDEDFSSTSDDASSHKRTQKSCRKCGKTKGDLKKYIARFRHQLETTTECTETEIRQQLDAFLEFLENHSAMFDSKDDENNTEIVQSPSQFVADAIELEEFDDDDYDDEAGIHVYGSDDTNTTTHPPKQFFNLNTVEKKEELDDLSVKQLKEVLMLNRVDFKGCCEKSELLERVQRLWDDLQNCPAVNKLPTVDLCKICMDAAIECVLLECGHMATCTNCGKVLSECPICRQYIVRVVRFFKA